MKVLVLADGVRADRVVQELERAGHKAVVAGGRSVVVTIIRAVRPDALLGVSDDPASTRDFLGAVEGAGGLPVLALASLAAADEVALVVAALAGHAGAVRSEGAARVGPVRAEPSRVEPQRAGPLGAAPGLPVTPPPVPRVSAQAPHVTPPAPPERPLRHGRPVVGPAGVGTPERRATGPDGDATRELVRVALEQARVGTYFDLLGLAPGATPEVIRQRVAAMTAALRPERIPRPLDAELVRALGEVGRALDDALYVLGDEELRPRYAAAITRSSAGPHP